MHTADWYFDVISPFAYLQLVRFDRLPDDLTVTYRPILFAGLLIWGRHRFSQPVIVTGLALIAVVYLLGAAQVAILGAAG